MLHNGFIPPELECLREIVQLERLVEALAEGPQRNRAAKKLQLLLRRDESPASCSSGLMRSRYLPNCLLSAPGKGASHNRRCRSHRQKIATHMATARAASRSPKLMRIISWGR